MKSRLQRVRASLGVLALALFWVGSLSASAAKTEPVHRAMDVVVANYVALCADLAADRAATLAGHVRALEGALGAVAKQKRTDDTTKAVQALAREAAGVISKDAALRGGDIARVREKLFALSKPLVRYVGRHRAAERRWKTYYCPMAKGSWLQPFAEAKLANPYYGKKMLTCGDPVRTRGE